MDLVAPQVLPGTDMVGKLRHQEGLADFGRSGKDICPCIEQSFRHRRPAPIGGLEQLCHGERMQVSGVCHTLHPAVHFFQAFQGIYNFIVDFFPGSGYTNGSIAIASDATAEHRAAVRKAQLSIAAQADGLLTLNCDGKKPTVDIPAVVVLLG